MQHPRAEPAHSAPSPKVLRPTRWLCLQASVFGTRRERTPVDTLHPGRLDGRAPLRAAPHALMQQSLPYPPEGASRYSAFVKNLGAPATTAENVACHAAYAAHLRCVECVRGHFEEGLRCVSLRQRQLDACLYWRQVS